MKNILSKILYIILAIVILMSLFIIIYANNPEFASVVKNISDSLPKPVIESEDEAEQSAVVSSSEESSMVSSSLESDEASEETSAGRYVLDKDANWNQSGLDSEITEEVGLTEYDESSFPSGSDEQINSKNDTEELKPNKVDVSTEDEAKEISDNTDTGETGKKLTFDETYYPYFAMLNDRGQNLYKQIYANAEAYNTDFAPIEEDATSSEVYNALISVLFDHPELFWLNSAMYTEYDYQGNVIKIALDFYDEFDAIESAKKEFESAADTLIAGAKELSSDYDKELYIHDQLVDKLIYKSGSLDQSAYSAIVGDETVCAGYAKAMQYLMQELEIPTYFCMGWGGSYLDGSLHGWDIVKLDSDYYNVDCTWDDQDPEIYDYFNVTDSDNYWHSRLWNSRYLPACNGTEYAYDNDAGDGSIVITISD